MPGRSPEPGKPFIPLTGRLTIALPAGPPEATARLTWIRQGAATGALEPLAVLEQLRTVAAANPKLIEAWTALGEFAADQGHWVEAFAFFRTAYHRGLDRLRASGWGGTGLVPWAEPTNQPFLRAVDGLRRASAALGETDEVERLAKFLVDLDPADHFEMGAARPAE